MASQLSERLSCADLCTAVKLPCRNFGPAPVFIIIILDCFCFQVSRFSFTSVCLFLSSMLLVVISALCFVVTCMFSYHIQKTHVKQFHTKKEECVFQDRSCDLCCLCVSVQYKSVVLSYERRQ